MGLDMYLKASLYISGWEHNGSNSPQTKLFYKLLKAAGIANSFVDQGSPSGNLEFNIGYWRKANAIHRWFVDEVQGGEDECNTHDVSMEKLKKLKLLCQTALDDKGNVAVAEKLLPPQGGGFFGSTEIDDGFYQDLEDTIKIVERCEALARPDGEDQWYFKYHSSW